MKLSKMTERLVGQPMFRLKQEADKMEKEGSPIIHFEIGDSVYSPPNEIVNNAVYSLLQGETHYSSSSGVPELKELIIKEFYNDTEYYIKDSQINIMPANAIIDFVFRCLCNKNDEVILIKPYFPTYSSSLIYNGIKMVEVLPQKDFKITAEEIEKVITPNTKLLVLNSPCNPSGVIIDKDELIKIYQLAQKNDFYILSDDTYKDIYYEDKPFLLSSLDGCQDRIIQLQSFSKFFAMAGFRIGYCVAPKDLSEKISLLYQTIFSCTPTFIQRAAQVALRIKDQFRGLRINGLLNSRQVMLDGLNKNGFMFCTPPEGSTYCWVNIGMNADIFAQELLKHEGVCVLPGSCFGAGCETYIRLCFDNSPENIINGTDKINYYLNGRADGV